MVFRNILYIIVISLPLVDSLRAKHVACRFLVPIVEDLRKNLFEDECSDAAHSALRLIFHDAIGISPTLGGGGADGSIAVFNATELDFPANVGLDDDLSDIAPWIHRYASVLSPGDFIQLAGAVSIAMCPGAPRVKYVIGRPPPTAPSPIGLVPQPADSIATILARFREVGFSPEEVVALLASHSIAGADDVDPTIPGAPFDSTPTVFDTQLFVEVLLKGTLWPGHGANSGEVKSAIRGTLRLESDANFARDPVTACIWQTFINNQAKMQKEFGAAIYKLSILGQTGFPLTDCSEVIPIPREFHGPATFPPTLSIANIQISCPSIPFPSLRTRPGRPLHVPPIPQV